MSDNPNVLLLAERYPPQTGGVARAASRLAAGLAGRVAEVRILNFTASVSPGVVQTAVEGSVTVHRVGLLRGRPDTLQLAADLVGDLHQRHDFSLLHGFYVLHAGYLAVLSAKVLGLRSVVSVRGNDLDRGVFRGESFGMLGWALREADVVSCVSRDLVAKARALTGREDIQYAPNAVQVDIFVPGGPDLVLRRELFPEADETAIASPLLGTIGELRFKKGVHILLEAFRRICEQRPAQLLLVGGARRPEREFVRNFLDAHPHLKPNVCLAEYVSDRTELVRYYTLLDVCVIPSLWEGMPNSALEAMACGCVVIASDAGGLSDLIVHGETGAVLGHHELDNLADLTLEVLDLDPAAQQEMGRKARAYVETHHSPEGEVERTLKAYGLALNTSP